MKEIWSNVSWEYPRCGGYTIRRGRKYLTIERLSNYTGNHTGGTARIAIDSGTGRAILAEIAQDRVDVEWLSDLDYKGGRIVQ
jgi:hypothetical protein